MQYASRSLEYALPDILLIAPLVEYLRSIFSARKCNILDIGPGSGLNMRMFAERGFKVTGIDISETVIKNIHNADPSMKLIHGDFLSTSLKQRYHGIFSKASLHLFPAKDGHRYLQKCYSLLVNRGMLYV